MLERCEQYIASLHHIWISRSAEYNADYMKASCTHYFTARSSTACVASPSYRYVLSDPKVIVSDRAAPARAGDRFSPRASSTSHFAQLHPILAVARGLLQSYLALSSTQHHLTPAEQEEDGVDDDCRNACSCRVLPTDVLGQTTDERFRTGRKQHSDDAKHDHRKERQDCAEICITNSNQNVLSTPNQCTQTLQIPQASF